MRRTTIDRILYATLAAGTFGTVTTTAIHLNLWIVSAAAANILAALYILAVTACAIDPNRVHLHRIALPLGALFWFGRAAFALQRLHQGASITFWTVVTTSAIIGIAFTGIHLLSVRAAVALPAVQASNDR